ncbi:MAG: protein-L-isoaspartate O-methyltransferase, partial [Methyloversatilis sp.]|nr:protein-L-isoaspartate O-methyltransferase [Methyloversatilis sp.]
ELVAQLRPGGRLIAFIGEEPLMNCVLVRLNADGTQSQEVLFETVVPTLRNARGAQRFVF